MWAVIRAAGPLFIGICLLMVGNGLLSTMLTIRGNGLGFSDSSIGLMQSGYPLGTLLGCLIAPKLITAVGHIRVFAALASIASASALVHLVTFDPWSWGAMRLLSGFCFSGLYIVSESWLKSTASNKNRGSLLSIYFIVQAGGVTLGQLLLNVSSPDGILLFIVVSILISVSIVPMLISANSNPTYETPERISFIELFRISPMGLTGTFLNGISQAALYVALALYGNSIGLSNGSIGVLLSSMTLGGMLFQFPLGKLSDVIDRRLVIVALPALSIPICILLASLSDPTNSLALLYALTFLLGGLTLPIYSICMAHMNDHLNTRQIVAASGSLVLILGTGMTVGPTLAGYSIDHYGPSGLFYLLSTISLLTVMTGLFRWWSSPASAEKRGNAVAISANLSPEAASLYPEASSTEKDRKRVATQHSDPDVSK